MITMLRQTQTKKYDRSFQVFSHCDNSADRSSLANKCRLFTKCGSHRVTGCVCVPAAVRTQIRLENTFGNDLHVGISFLDEISDELHNFVGVLIWYQPHADLGFSSIWNRSFDA